MSDGRDWGLIPQRVLWYFPVQSKRPFKIPSPPAWDISLEYRLRMRIIDSGVSTMSSTWSNFTRKRRKHVKKSGKYLLRKVADYMGRHSLIGDKPFFDTSIFPWLEDFEVNWEKIRAELDQVLETQNKLPTFHEISPDQGRISTGDNWKTFGFYVFGDRFDPNCKRCPETARLLDRVPNLENAMFSILSPGYHIPPHQGPTKGIIRIHLGLIIPEQRDKCVIRVADQTSQWEEGKCIILDDFYDHEVWNDTDQKRVVLFFDVDRPLPPLGRFLNRLLIAGIKRSVYVKNAKKNLLAWDREYQRNVFFF